MTSIEKRNAARTRRIAIIGTVLFHVVLLGYLYYSGSSDGVEINQLIESIAGTTDAQPKA